MTVRTCSSGRWLNATASALTGGLILLSLQAVSFAQPARAQVTTAFQNVNLISMERNELDPGRTVIVKGERIVAIGATGEVPLPADAVVIEGAGRYLLPGLTDAHVHLEAWEGARPDFGDGPLYLASGVTTVVNLRGTPASFDWRRRIQSGELVGPTIYTSGEFLIGPWGPELRAPSGRLVVGPNVSTPEDAAREVAAQLRNGVDVIKFYGGLPLLAYLRMNDAARAAGIPVVGHRPINLGFEAVVEARQSLSHLHMLSNLYFWPISSNRMLIAANVVALVLLIIVVGAAAAGSFGRLRQAFAELPAARLRLRTAGRLLLVAGILALAVQIDILVLGRVWSPSVLLAVFIFLALLTAALTVASVTWTHWVWRQSAMPLAGRLGAVSTTVAGLLLVIALAGFWVPMSWRTTDAGLEHLGDSLGSARIPVQTTLAAFSILTSSPHDRRRLQGDAALDDLAPVIRDAWRRLPVGEGAVVSPRALDFMKRVTRALHREGVLLVAGTDSLGAPLMIPGISLHKELQLLADSGLTPYESLRTATVNPAVFLGKENEFGTITSGRRADLVLIERNPLEDLTALQNPTGVMVRGRWFAREALEQMIAQLRTQQ